MSHTPQRGSGSLCCSGALRAAEVVESSRPAVRDRRYKNEADPLPAKGCVKVPEAWHYKALPFRTGNFLGDLATRSRRTPRTGSLRESGSANAPVSKASWCRGWTKDRSAFGSAEDRFHSAAANSFTRCEARRLRFWRKRES
jgi:hypothetical protein